MSIKLKWMEKGSSHYTDEIPDWMLTIDGKWDNTNHDFYDQKGNQLTATCDVTTAGEVVTLDYLRYNKENEFEPGVLRIAFGDATRTGKPTTVEWKNGRDGDFQEIRFRVAIEELEELNPEKEISLVDKSFDFSNLTDARRHTLRSLAMRQGQQKFRSALMSAYQNKCALTGCSEIEVLEAAHIIGFLGPHTNHVQNGLLLRADIHTLFDKGLLGINPDNWKVILHPCIQKGSYSELHGLEAHLPNEESKHPSKEALRHHIKSSGLKK